MITKKNNRFVLHLLTNEVGWEDGDTYMKPRKSMSNWIRKQHMLFYTSLRRIKLSEEPKSFIIFSGWILTVRYLFRVCLRTLEETQQNCRKMHIIDDDNNIHSKRCKAYSTTLMFCWRDDGGDKRRDVGGDTEKTWSKKRKTYTHFWSSSPLNRKPVTLIFDFAESKLPRSKVPPSRNHDLIYRHNGATQLTRFASPVSFGSTPKRFLNFTTCVNINCGFVGFVEKERKRRR